MTRKILAAAAAGAVAFITARKVRDSQETKKTWKSSTDTVA